MPKSAYFSQGASHLHPFNWLLGTFWYLWQFIPCFNYFLLEHSDVMCFGLFICCKMFICNIIELIVFYVPWVKVRLWSLENYSTSTDCLTNWIYIQQLCIIQSMAIKNCINISQDMWSEIYYFLLNILILDIYCGESLSFITEEKARKSQRN